MHSSLQPSPSGRLISKKGAFLHFNIHFQPQKLYKVVKAVQTPVHLLSCKVETKTLYSFSPVVVSSYYSGEQVKQKGGQN